MPRRLKVAWAALRGRSVMTGMTIEGRLVDIKHPRGSIVTDNYFIDSPSPGSGVTVP